jgi:hypothetical protein
VEHVDASYKVVNDRIDSFSKGGKQSAEEKGIIWTIILSLYLLIVNMIIPVLPFASDWYKSIEVFP